MSAYRPTVRYAPVFRDYVDDVFKATHLDRNQIIRLALFVAAHSQEFKTILNDYKKKDVPLPCPEWQLLDRGYWLEQCPVIEKGGKDVNVNATGRTTTQNDSRNDEARSILLPNVSPDAVPSTNRRIAPIERRNGEISSKRLPDGRIQIREQGRIEYRFEERHV